GRRAAASSLATGRGIVRGRCQRGHRGTGRARGNRDMGLGDRWAGCMHTMGMPTPTEAWDSAVEGIEKLHEIDLALGGLGLAEAAEHRGKRGVVLEGAGEAGALTVSWWVGNAIGCIVTAAVGDQIVDAIDYIVQPVNWAWIEAKMYQVNY